MLKKCPVCGKEFICAYAKTWQYKIGKNRVVVCSYECARTEERVKEEKKRNGKETRTDL